MASMAQIYPLHILIASLAGLMNRQQAEVLEYLIEENRVLREQLKGKALRLNDDHRRRLAAKGKRIGRRRDHAEPERHVHGIRRRASRPVSEGPTVRDL